MTQYVVAIAVAWAVLAAIGLFCYEALLRRLQREAEQRHTGFQSLIKRSRERELVIIRMLQEWLSFRYLAPEARRAAEQVFAERLEELRRERERDAKQASELAAGASNEP